MGPPARPQRWLGVGGPGWCGAGRAILMRRPRAAWTRGFEPPRQYLPVSPGHWRRAIAAAIGAAITAAIGAGH